MRPAVNGLVRPAYDRMVRPWLPKKLEVLNGVTTRRAGLLDQSDFNPNYKDALVDGIRDVTRPDDVVRDIGGGWGVATVVAARCATEGEVVTYEPSIKQARVVRETARLNNVENRVSVEEVLIEVAVQVWGQSSGETMPASEIEACDVLVMDCEGAEADIIPSLSFDPRAIVVELHPQFGVDVHDAIDRLRSDGYRVSLDKITGTDCGGQVAVARKECQ